MIFYLAIWSILLLLPNSNKKKGGVLFFLIVGTISAIRYDVGYDYMNYLDIILGRNTYAIAYDRLEPLCKSLINASRYLGYPQLFFIITSIAIVAAISFWIYNESKNYKLSILIFMGLPMFFWASLSIIRQFLAISFGTLFFLNILRDKNKQSILWLILAVLSHSSALILICGYLAKRNWSTKTQLVFYISSFFAGTLLFSLISWGGIPILERAKIFLQHTDLKGFTHQITLFNIFFIGYFILLRQQNSNPTLNFYARLFILGVVLLNALSFAPVFAGRLSSFFLISLIILLPNAIAESKHKPLYFASSTVLFSFFFVYTLHLASSSHENGLTSKDPYIPYKTYLTH